MFLKATKMLHKKQSTILFTLMSNRLKNIVVKLITIFTNHEKLRIYTALVMGYCINDPFMF